MPVEKVVTGLAQPRSEGLDEALTLPKQEARSGDAYLRFIPRTEMDIAVCSAGVNLTLGANGVVKGAWRLAPLVRQLWSCRCTGGLQARRRGVGESRQSL